MLLLMAPAILHSKFLAQHGLVPQEGEGLENLANRCVLRLFNVTLNRHTHTHSLTHTCE